MIKSLNLKLVVAGGVVLGVAALGAIGGGRVGEAQERPRVPMPRDSSARSKAAQEIVDILQRGVEVDLDALFADLRTPEELAERRLEIAQELMEFALVKFLEPPTPTAQRGTFHAAIEDYMAWSLRRLEASLDLADDDDARRNAIGREVAKIRRVEEIYRDIGRVEGVGVTRQNQLSLAYRRLELETKLARHAAGNGDLTAPLTHHDPALPESP